jgi:S1-C subfamily serine protease
MKRKTSFSVHLPVIMSFIFLILFVGSNPSSADEGMWTFDNLPIKLLQERYGFTPTQQWLDHIRLSSVRLGGGSGSFVSQNGLIMTNHHVAVGQLQKISTEEKDYVATGFLAKTFEDEVKCRIWR